MGLGVRLEYSKGSSKYPVEKEVKSAPCGTPSVLVETRRLCYGDARWMTNDCGMAHELEYFMSGVRYIGRSAFKTD